MGKRKLNRISAEMFYRVCEVLKEIADDNMCIPQSSYTEVADTLSEYFEGRPFSVSTVKSAMKTVGISFNQRIDIPYLNARMNDLEARIAQLEEAYLDV